MTSNIKPATSKVLLAEMIIIWVFAVICVFIGITREDYLFEAIAVALFILGYIVGTGRKKEEVEKKCKEPAQSFQ